MAFLAEHGLHLWPVAVLLVLGLGCFAMEAWSRSRRELEHDEMGEGL